jgi:hypothetical protein
MAVFNKFNQFVKNLADGVHLFSTHTFKIMLTNTAPVSTNQVKADLTEIAAGFGYTAGGTATTISVTVAGGIAKVTGTNVVFTAAGGSIGPFRYAVLYNDTPASPLDPLVAYWDYGASITLANTEVLTVVFDAADGILQLQ